MASSLPPAAPNGQPPTPNYYSDPTERPCRDCGCDPCDHNSPDVGGCNSCGDCEGWI